MPRKIEVSHRTILFTFFVLGAVLLLWEIRDILLILFVSLLVTAILNPIVRRLSKYKVPRSLSVLLVYLLVFALIIFAIAGIVPALVEQTSHFLAGLPGYIENLNLPEDISRQISTQVLNSLGDVPGSVLGFGIGIVSNIFTLLTVLTFAFYLLMARNKFESQLSKYVGEKRANEVSEVVDELEDKLGGWARGQIALMLTVGVFSYVGLLVLGVPYALPLAIFAGLMELVPYAGPFIGAVPAVLIGFGISPLIGAATSALAILIQQVENYVLAPKIMEKSVGVAPVVTLVSLAVGLKLAGITGVLISIPIVITLQVLLKRRFFSGK